MRQLVPVALVAAGALAFPSRSPGGEPLCDWLDALGHSAQARADGAAGAHLIARRALEALPSGPAAVRARLELALALPPGTDAAERARLLGAAAAEAPPAVRAALLAATAESLLAADEPRGASDSFRTAAAEGLPALALRARWRNADALHAGGDAAEAVRAWRALASDTLASNFDLAVRLAYGLDLRATDGPRAAAEILRSLWSNHPERPEAAAAERALDRWRAEGDAVPPFTAEERIARAYRLVAVGRAAEAEREIARAEGTLPPPPEGHAALATAAALLARGRPADALRAVEPLAQSRDPGLRRGAALVQARAASRERRIPDAISAWRRVAASSAEVPGLPASALASLRDDAEYFAAWLHFDAGDPAAAAAALERLVATHPGSRRAEDARWFAAWGRVRAGDAARAAPALRRLDEGSSAPRARYWRARIASDPQEAHALLRSTVAADPLGYYGILARARLAAAGLDGDPPPLAPGPAPLELDALPEAARLRQAALLASYGLREEAIAELASIASNHGGRRAAQPAAELAAFLGDPLVPFRVARDQLGLSRRTLSWSFPDAWPALLQPLSRAAGVDPALVRAVMRRESGFRRDARSAAGAVGLLQIVPGTAARLSALLGLPAPFAERMEEPAVNVPLGTGYLALLLERFGEPLVAVAAYNAGPNAVLRWTRPDAELPLDVWVESIPFRETRQYVRAVVENWAGARAAAGEPPPGIDPDRAVRGPGPGVAF